MTGGASARIRGVYGHELHELTPAKPCCHRPITIDSYRRRMNLYRSILLNLLALTLVGLVPVAGAAQQTESRIVGTVVDQNGGARRSAC